MFIQRTFLTLTAVLLLMTLLAPSVAAECASPITTITSRTGSGFISAGQAVWHGSDCAAPTGMSPENGDSYVCRPPVKLPQPQPQRRPLPIRLP